MTKIFLSYRRQDTKAIAGRIFDRLEAKFGRDAVFMDVDSIPPGVDFHEWLNGEVAQASIVVALIGPDWANARDNSGNRRLDNPNDFVRIELEAALLRKIPIVPLLIDGAPFPRLDEFPNSLKPLTRRNAAILDAGRDFNVHMARLIEALELHLSGAWTPTKAALPPLEPEPETFINNWFGSSTKRRAAAEKLYDELLSQSRNQTFYVRLGVPDTLSGRFDMLTIHLFILQYSLKLFDHNDAKLLYMDILNAFNLEMHTMVRDLGIAEVYVDEEVRKVVDLFFKQIKVYEMAVDKMDKTLLANAILQSFTDSNENANVESVKLAQYVFDAIAVKQPLHNLLQGYIVYPEVFC
jgi:cytochrome b pre-mRNA-processing protein 3